MILTEAELQKMKKPTNLLFSTILHIFVEKD